jgi:hypothetical protein
MYEGSSKPKAKSDMEDIILRETLNPKLIPFGAQYCRTF